MIGASIPAACAPAQAAEPFEVIPLPEPSRQGHGWAYAAMIAGAGCVGLSYTFSHRAERQFADYERATDPAQIDRLYDRTRTYDRLSSGSLLAGEALVATGIYLRFLRRPHPGRYTFSLGPGRCALELRF